MMAKIFFDPENRRKECRKCGVVHSFDDFYPQKRSLGGRRAACKWCLSKSPNGYAPKSPKGFFDLEQRMKECYKCRLVLSFDDFSKSSICKGGVNSRCKKCSTVDARDKHLKRNYGLTAKQYQALADSQHGACAICRTEDVKLYIDHCHDTGKVRGLLCGTCNSGIGLLGDSPGNLDAAAAYLRRVGAA